MQEDEADFILKEWKGRKDAGRAGGLYAYQGRYSGLWIDICRHICG